MPANEILIPETEIQTRLTGLAAEINAALPDGPVHVVMILKGAIIFGVDLARALERNTTLGFLTASSYGEGTQSTGKRGNRRQAPGRHRGAERAAHRRHSRYGAHVLENPGY